MLDFFSKERTLLYLFIGGCVLRVLVYFVLNASNPDPHFEVLRYIKEFHRLPHTDELFSSAHPPLYYVMAMPFYWFDNPATLKFTQFFSLLIGLFNLYLIFKLLPQIISDSLIRNLSFLIAAFNPTFLGYSLYVSNDTLAFLMGTSIFYLMYRYVKDTSNINEIMLAVVTGLALLTKTTFLPLIPVIILTVVVNFWNQKRAKTDIFIRLVAFTAIVGALGGFKFMENKYYLHSFFLHNLDFFSVGGQATFRGLDNFLNFNLWDLITFPGIFNDDHATRYAYFLTFYATFWYKHIDFENNLNLGNYTSFKYIGSLIYILGVIPTLTFIMGLFLQIKKAIVTVWDNIFFKISSSETTYSAFLTAIFVLSIAAIFGAGIKYDGWSFFHGRFVGHVMVPLLVIMAAGFQFLQKRNTVLFKLSAFSLIGASSLHIVYFMVEAVGEMMGL